MMQPIGVDVDLEIEAGYVRYLADAQCAGTIDVWHDGQVAADLDASQRVIGIEVLGLDKETLKHAREFAARSGLAFPDDLAGNRSSA